MRRMAWLLGAIAPLFIPTTRAATFTWDGNLGGTPTGSSKWSFANNWATNVAPSTSGDSIIFAGTTKLTPSMDSNYSIVSLTFASAAGAFTLSSPGTETLTIGTGGITNSSTNTQTITSSLILSAAQTWNAASGALTINSATVTNGGFLLTISGASNTSIAAAIIGTGGLTYSGAGTLTLSGANSYSGATTLSGGTLILNGSNSSAGTTTTSGGSMLQLGAGANGGLASGLLTLGNSTIESTDSTARTISNAVKFTANTTFGAASVNTGALTFNGTVDLNGSTRTLTTVSNTTFANAISSSSGTGVGITKLGAGTLTFSGSAANTYDGVTTVNVGELDLNKTAGVNAIAGNLTIGDGTGTDTVKLLAANQIANTSDITINSSGVLNLNNNAETIDGLSSASSTSSVTLGTGTLTVGANNQTSATFAGVISGTGGNLAKSGSGTQTLSGNNTYTGTTTINASGGTLEIANSGSTSSGRISGTSGVTVNSGGTLLLSGSSSFTDRINDSATMTLNGGTFNTGGLSERGGTLAAPTAGIGALTLTATSTIDFGPGSSSIIEFAGIGAHTPATGPDLAIINWNGITTIGGGTERLLFAGTASSFTTQFSQSDVSFNGITGYNAVQFSGFYEITAVPEASTWLGGALALAAIGFTQRRRFARLVSAPKPA